MKHKRHAIGVDVDVAQEGIEWLLLLLAAINAGVYTAALRGWFWSGVIVMSVGLTAVYLAKARSR